MERITEKQLESLVEYINKLTNSPPITRTLTTGEKRRGGRQG